MKSKFSEVLNLIKQKKTDEAKKICLEILKIDQNNAEVYNIYAFTLFHLKEYESSINNWKKAIKIKPNHFHAINNLGNAFLKLKKYTEALLSYEQAIKINSNYFEAYNNRGHAFFGLNKLSDALESYNQAIKIKPDYFEAYNAKAFILQKLQRFDEAIKNWRNATKINPNLISAHINLGHIFFDLKKYEEAINSYNCAFVLDPEYPFLLGQLIYTKLKISDWKNLKENLNELEKNILKFKKASSPLPILAFFDSPYLQKITAEIWAKEHVLKNNKMEGIFRTEINKKNKKIRIGYYSADFKNHAVGLLIANMLELHDKSKFEIFGFYFGTKTNDKVHNRIVKSCDNFLDISSMDDKEVTELSRNLDIDIAIDLMAHSGTTNRFNIFINRCAPIQINFLGYPGTSGSDCIDYLIADKNLIPKKNQKFYSEKIVYLPHTYQPNDSTRKIPEKIFDKKEFGLPEKSFVLCCFNAHQKITPSVFKIWMKLLKSNNNSILWLLEDNLTSCKNLRLEASLEGVDSERIIFSKRMPVEEHLARHKVADLFVDTFPYTAHTTCSDSLLAGLPVLTCIGESFASRVAASLLNAIDLPELIVSSKKEYEEMAIKIMDNPNYLKEIKKKLERNKLEKPLFDTKLFTKHLEMAFNKMYQTYVGNEKLENIEIRL